MSYLKRSEQIRIESVRQLIQVYRVLEKEWQKEFSINDEINSFIIASSVKWYVNYLGGKIAMHGNNDHCDTITFEQFMSRVNPEPKTETTIIESTDGKKYEVIMVREVVEPLTFHKWYDEFYSFNSGFNVLGNSDQNSYIEKYIEYRKSLDL